MVVFTCNHCGESLQKPRVEKHYNFTCRSEKFLTCVDCFTDFRGDEYNVHTKCVTEEERYSGKDYVQKAKKGEVKQESWIEMIKSIILHETNLSPNYKNLLDLLCQHSNVPRKKGKFMNFIKSSTGNRTNIKDIEGVWNIIEKYKSQNSEPVKEKICNNSNNETAPNHQEENYSKQTLSMTDAYQETENTGDRKISKKKKHKICNSETIELIENNNFEQPKKRKYKENVEQIVENINIEITNKQVHDNLNKEIVANHEEGNNSKEELNVTKAYNQETENIDGQNITKKKRQKIYNAKDTLIENNNSEVLKKRKYKENEQKAEIENIERSSKKKKINKLNGSQEVVSLNNDIDKKEELLHTENSNFSFYEEISKILSDYPTISKRKLYKKLSKVYLKLTGETIGQEKLEKKVNKKLKKFSNVILADDCVQLIAK